MTASARPRVFLDTNVVFSALHSPTGAPAEILRLHIDGNIQMVVSQQVLEELARTISTELPQAVDSVQTLLLSTPPFVVPDPPRPLVDRWSQAVGLADAPVIAAAVEPRVDYFVTADRRLPAKLRASTKAALIAVSPREFLDSLD